MRQIARIAILASACTSAFAQHDRIEMGWTGENGYFERDTPSTERAFRYYISDQRQHEFLRAETDNCGDPSSCKDQKVKVSREELGSAFDKNIVQIVFTLAGTPGNDGKSEPHPFWKSILIETRPGIYRELLLLKNEGGFWSWPAGTSEVLDAGETKLLVSSDNTMDRDMPCTGEIWILGESGATRADFSEVEATIKKTVPRGAQDITPMCAAVDIGKLEVRSNIQKADPECSACGFEGQVVLKFRFDGPRAIPVSAKLTNGTE